MLPPLVLQILHKVNFGDIVYVEIETKGKALTAESVFGTVEAVKNSKRSFSPCFRNNQ